MWAEELCGPEEFQSVNGNPNRVVQGGGQRDPYQANADPTNSPVDSKSASTLHAPGWGMESLCTEIPPELSAYPGPTPLDSGNDLVEIIITSEVT
jgi:hypothetical protein